MLDNHTTPHTAAQQSFVYSVKEGLSVLDQAVKAGIVNEGAKSFIDTTRTLALLGVLEPSDIPNKLNHVLAVSDAAKSALDIIKPLFLPGDVIELRALDPRGARGNRCQFGRLDMPEERARLEDFIRRNNGHKNLYVGANPRHENTLARDGGGKAEDVSVRRNVVLDLDNKDAPPDNSWANLVSALAATGPALIVETGNGYHVWHPIDPEPAGNDAQDEITKALDAVGSDSIGDLPRIVRLPFTVNIPTKQKRARQAVPRLALPATSTPLTAARRSVRDLCAELHRFASTNGLPGKAAKDPASLTTKGGSEKTPSPAPSLDLLRMALSELPNQPGGVFSDRDDWQRFGHAVKGAAMAAGIEAEARPLWLEWCAECGGDPNLDEKFWDTCRPSYAGWVAIKRTLERINPNGAHRLSVAEAKEVYAGAEATNRAALTSSTFSPVRQLLASTIAPRPWLYGRSIIRRYISVLVAPGGAGKSSLILAEAVAMATGRELLDGERPIGLLKVWYHNQEDDQDELDRRLVATLMCHSLTTPDLGANLFTSSGRQFPIRLARLGRDGPEAVPGVVDGIVEMISQNGIDVFILDPLAACHALPENDNGAMNFLSGILREIADRTGAAIIILHHSGKQAAMDMDAAGVGASRGASAITDAARVVRTMVRMTPKEAAKYGVSEKDRRTIFRTENGKANLSPTDDARWYQTISVALKNGSSMYPEGDYVGAVERWHPPVQQPGSTSELKRVQDAINAEPTPQRTDKRAKNWVGVLVSRVLGLDIGPKDGKSTDRTTEQAAAVCRVEALVRGWIASGGLKEAEWKDPTDHKHKKVIKVGIPAELMSETGTPDSEKDGAE